MKKVLYVILILVLMWLVYMPCRALAVAERGTDLYIGGEALVPFLVPLVAMYIAEFKKCGAEDEEEKTI